MKKLKKTINEDVKNIQAKTGMTREQVGYITGMLVMFYLGLVFSLLVNAFLYDGSNLYKITLLMFSLVIGLIILLKSSKMLLDNHRAKEIVFNKGDWINLDDDLDDFEEGERRDFEV